MKIAEIKELKDKRPFVPFLIRTAGGREFEVRHPDALAWADDNPRVVVVTPGGGRLEVLDVALVESLSLENKAFEP
jgi:hypothetical protein